MSTPVKPLSMTDNAREKRIRKALARRGQGLQKGKRPSASVVGYQIVDSLTRNALIGDGYTLTLGELEQLIANPQ
jgi:hypothetical protein